MISKEKLSDLNSLLKGDLFYDDLTKAIYATDASVYRMIPIAVAFPKEKSDIKELIHFARKFKISIIPRTAGTSLAGQCVGDGIIVDVSKYFNKILDFNVQKKTVTVQPGVVRDSLNNYLKPFGLFFGPNTSTSNRCMIGGMVGNNSSGTTSIKYGVTRDKVIKLNTILSDGSEVAFEAINATQFHEKRELKTLEGKIYECIFNELNAKSVHDEIKKQFPKNDIHRRNNGYAIDELIKSQVLGGESQYLNMCKLLSGSEGTLAFSTEITLKLDVLPPNKSIMVAAHFQNIENCLNAVSLVMNHDLHTCEMLDKTILDLTKLNKLQQENRQFIYGDPKAILMCEIKADSLELAQERSRSLISDLNQSQLSYANVSLINDDIDKALRLRKAGLGLLGNLIGDSKSVACIEDTAVSIQDLANYIKDFTELMDKHNQRAVYYAHAGAGELHLRPILNLKKDEDVKLFRIITTEVANLVKKYGGSMSGEHGDGIVRAEFIPIMLGEKNYEILKHIKKAFDPDNIFNPGKIVHAFPMDQSLRYKTNRSEPNIETILDFSDTNGILRHAEKCNGSGDCRKLPEFGGTMCPSYRATHNEKDSTRARANALREFLTNSNKSNRFNHEELKDVFDLCLSCKACSTECPSSVDVAALKAEFQYQYQMSNGFNFKNKFFANSTKYNKMASRMPFVFNTLFQGKLTSALIKKALGMHQKRSLPIISKSFTSLQAQIQGIDNGLTYSKSIKTVFLFVDEFINYLESHLANISKLLLESLGYNVIYVSHLESGRSYISKGFLLEAKTIANKNIKYFKDEIDDDFCLIGIEPSAILTFKDEYLKLADDIDTAKKISERTFLIEEFIHQEIQLGNIRSEQFTLEERRIKYHGHCYQKAMSNQLSSFSILNFPKNYKATIIPSGCCGMAGSFGYEQEHYDISMDIGEQTLFPAIRKADEAVLISANGTSCRHQIKDGTQRLALHPIEIFYDALLK